MGSTYRTLNPTTEIVEQEFPTMSWPAAESAVQRAAVAQQSWRAIRTVMRGHALLVLAEHLRKQRGAMARLITVEMGKPIVEARAEIEKCAWLCEYYAQHGEAMLQNEIIASDATESYVEYDPLGVIFGIMPWNFPFWQVFRCAVPALLVGNTFILKHASNVPQCARAIAAVFTQSGFPDGVFQSLLLSSDDAGQVIASPHVRGVSLTGSTQAGRQVAMLAGQHLKKCVLELGGSDPCIVLEDANLVAAAETAIRSRMLNSGQSCIAAKRFIVVERIAKEFERRCCELVKHLVVGDPLDEATQIGPLARADLVTELARQVEASRDQGAVFVCGGQRRGGKGFFFDPTVLSQVTPTMTTFTEEVFGPVVSIIIVKNEEDAIALANQSPYGLGASLWTQNLDRAKALATQIEAGAVFINGMVKSDPRLPFGGIKDSGYGRELGPHGLREFTNIKTVWVGQ